MLDRAATEIEESNNKSLTETNVGISKIKEEKDDDTLDEEEDLEKQTMRRS